MTIEKFLQFWNQYNPLIIEGLIGLIILMSLFLAYRSFFSKKAQHAETEASAGGGGLDAGQLEKTLQKILENQNLNAKLAANDDLSVDAPIEHDTSAGDGGEAAPEVAQLRATLSDSNKKIQILQTQLAQAQEQATQAQAAAASSSPAAAGAAPGISSEERNELNAKLLDFEARLAEYEIISEDIADLSKYREENDDLKKQLEAFKSQLAQAPAAAPVAPAPVPAAPAPEPVVAVAPTPEPEPTPAPVAAAAPQSSQDAVDEAMNAAVLKMTPQSTESAPPPADLIDDDLMKEFAAAVEGQKALDQAAQKAGDGSEKATTNTDDTDKLMNEFENFVGNKKS